MNFTRDLRFEQADHSNEDGVLLGRLILPNKYRSAWIIDGQHRLYGFSPVHDRFLDQNIIVVAFERLPKIEEASLFVTINHEQKSVPKHLLDDLEGELKWESIVPSERVGAIVSRLINLLNIDIDEPFHSRVTQHGIKSTSKTCLTIPGIKDTIVQVGLVGRSILNDSQYEPGPFTGKSDSETLDRARTALNAYFRIIADANPAQWEKGRDGFLSTNVGVQAFVRLLASLIDYWEMNNNLDAKEYEPTELISELEEYLEPIVAYLSKASDADIEARFTVVLGSSGPKMYYFKLCQLIKAERGDFKPEGLAEFEMEQSDDNFNRASEQLRKLEIAINSYIFDLLRQRFAGAYWEKGIPDKNIRVEAYARQQDDAEDKRGTLESYLNLLDYKKIVENRQNWPFFKSVFNIAEPDGQKGLAKYLKWMDEVNELRRIPAHPSGARRFQLDDYTYIDWIATEFINRVQDARSKGIKAHVEEVENLVSCSSALHAQ